MSAINFTSPSGMYWHVDFFDDKGLLDHNDVVGGFEELASLAQGRSFKIMGIATAAEHADALAARSA